MQYICHLFSLTSIIRKRKKYIIKMLLPCSLFMRTCTVNNYCWYIFFRIFLTSLRHPNKVLKLRCHYCFKIIILEDVTSIDTLWQKCPSLLDRNLVKISGEIFWLILPLSWGRFFRAVRLSEMKLNSVIYCACCSPPYIAFHWYG